MCRINSPGPLAVLTLAQADVVQAAHCSQHKIFAPDSACFTRSKACCRPDQLCTRSDSESSCAGVQSLQAARAPQQSAAGIRVQGPAFRAAPIPADSHRRCGNAVTHRRCNTSGAIPAVLLRCADTEPIDPIPAGGAILFGAPKGPIQGLLRRYPQGGQAESKRREQGRMNAPGSGSWFEAGGGGPTCPPPRASSTGAAVL